MDSICSGNDSLYGLLDVGSVRSLMSGVGSNGVSADGLIFKESAVALSSEFLSGMSECVACVGSGFCFGDASRLLAVSSDLSGGCTGVLLYGSGIRDNGGRCGGVTGCAIKFVEVCLCGFCGGMLLFSGLCSSGVCAGVLGGSLSGFSFSGSGSVFSVSGVFAGVMCVEGGGVFGYFVSVDSMGSSGCSFCTLRIS